MTWPIAGLAFIGGCIEAALTDKYAVPFPFTLLIGVFGGLGYIAGKIDAYDEAAA